MVTQNKLFKFTLLAMLSALGVVLMSYIQFPYPLAPFLKVEVSDFVVVLVFMLFGFKEGLIVAVVKTLGDLLFHGPVGPYGVGQITAFVASISYCLMLFLSNFIFRKKNEEGLWVKRNVGMEILRYVFVIFTVSVIMTFANYFVLTPVFLGEHSFLDMKPGVLSSMIGLDIDSYLLTIIILYMPFNILKGILICGLTASCGEVILAIYRRRLKGATNNELKDVSKSDEGTDLQG